MNVTIGPGGGLDTLRYHLAQPESRSSVVPNAERRSQPGERADNAPQHVTEIARPMTTPLHAPTIS
ncbi:MAG TPA: hypothetical protein VFX65_10305 [Candidatus Limnocylindrales bacterium]|nr:hypothetical protein [Candidatus Limnocylindrales bacterium]